MKVKFKSKSIEEDFVNENRQWFGRIGRDYYISPSLDMIIDPVNYVVYGDAAYKTKLGSRAGRDLLEVNENGVTREYFDKLNEVLREVE